MKNKRQQKILELIDTYNIDTQEMMIDLLRKEGINATQTTISRDIRELRLTKIACGFGVYKYVVSSQEQHSHSAKYLNILRETVTAIDHAGNIVVVKTYAGMAQAAAAALDSMGWTEIIGSIAGDDTIMLVVRSADAARVFSSELSGLLGIQK